MERMMGMLDGWRDKLLDILEMGAYELTPQTFWMVRMALIFLAAVIALKILSVPLRWILPYAGRLLYRIRVIVTSLGGSRWTMQKVEKWIAAEHIRLKKQADKGSSYRLNRINRLMGRISGLLFLAAVIGCLIQFVSEPVKELAQQLYVQDMAQIEALLDSYNGQPAEAQPLGE